MNILVVCEGNSDFPWVTRLVNRAAEEFGDYWVRQTGAEHLLVYLGVRHEQPFVPWSAVGGLIDELLPDSNRRFGLFRPPFASGFPANPDAVRFYKFWNAVQNAEDVPKFKGVVFAHDENSAGKRGQAFRDMNAFYAQPEHRSNVVVGVPHPETECWLLAGFFHNATDAERQAVEDYKRDTDGVDPCRHSELLNAPHETEVRHPKQALRTLCPSEERQMQCLEAPFDLLRHYGQHNGLVQFLNELERRFVPALFGGPSAPPR